MKKIFVMAVMAAATLTASAQYTPKAGTFGTQITFRPFGSASDTKSTFALDDAGIVGRYFFTDKSAVRVGFDFGWQDTTEPQFTNNWNNNKKEKSGENVTSSTKWGINVGYEYYFANYNRLNLYAGGQVGVDMVNNKTKFNTADRSKYGDDTETKTGTTNLKFGAFIGANYFIYKNLFVAAEIGLNYTHGIAHDKKETSNGTTVSTEGGSSNKLGFRVSPEVSLGINF